MSGPDLSSAAVEQLAAIFDKPKLITLHVRTAATLRGLAEQRAVARAAIQRQVENIDRWRETGVPAGPEESREIYEGLCAALARIGGE